VNQVAVQGLGQTSDMTPRVRSGTDRPDGDVLVALPDDVGAPALARQAVRETLLAWRLADLIDDVQLAVSELVTNAFQHARPPVFLRLSQRRGKLRIDVSDMRPATQTLVLPVVSKDSDESGRGRGIVAAVSDHSGTDDAAGEGDSTSAYASWDVDPLPPAPV
jgi:anti-sigma regulatory factor (Ser/Thr protein kinase)